jgi:NUMOD4 motif.
MIEIWIDVKGYEGLYQVSNQGRVKTFGREYELSKNNIIKYDESLLKPFDDPKGYHRVKLYKNKEHHTIKLHRLVALHFIPNTDNKPQVNHIDGNKKNNYFNNLEWCTNKENSIHRDNFGLQKILEGSKNGMSKLTENQVSEIKKLLLSKKQNEIARIYNVSVYIINRIALNKTWRHVA